MWISAALVLAVVGVTPEYDWSTLALDSDAGRYEVLSYCLAEDRDANPRLVAVMRQSDLMFLVVHEGHSKLTIRSRLPWDISEIIDFGCLDSRRVVLTTGKEIIQVSLKNGKMLNRVPSLGLGHFAVLASGDLGGVVTVTCSEALAVAISPENGRVVTVCNKAVPGVFGEEFVVGDPSGTRFAGGGMNSSLWVSAPYVQWTRTPMFEGGDSYCRRGCFDPSGRFLAVSNDHFGITVFDLCQPGFCSPFDLRTGEPQPFPEHPGYIGKLGKQRRSVCTGLGFIGKHWLWAIENGRLYFCRWRQRPPMIVTESEVGDPIEFRESKGTRDGHLLVGLDANGELHVGRLKCMPN